MQLGFDDGFEKGIQIGKVCGTFYAQCLLEISREHHGAGRANESVSANNMIKDDLKKILYDDFDVTCEQYSDVVVRLRQLIGSKIPKSAAVDMLCDQLELDLSHIHTRNAANFTD